MTRKTPEGEETVEQPEVPLLRRKGGGHNPLATTTPNIHDGASVRYLTLHSYTVFWHLKLSVLVSMNYFERTVISILSSGPVPGHIGFVMDGNRRYARRHQKEVKDGHAEGYVALRRVRLRISTTSRNY